MQVVPERESYRLSWTGAICIGLETLLMTDGTDCAALLQPGASLKSCSRPFNKRTPCLVWFNICTHSLSYTLGWSEYTCG